MNNLDQKSPFWTVGLKLFVEVTSWIAIPIVLSLLAGKWLDDRYQTEPWFFLGLTGLAFIATLVGIVRIGKRYIKEAENTVNKNGDDRR